MTTSFDLAAIGHIAREVTLDGVTFRMLPYRPARFDMLERVTRGVTMRDEKEQPGEAEAVFLLCESVTLDIQVAEDAAPEAQRFGLYWKTRTGDTAGNFNLYAVLFTMNMIGLWYTAYERTRDGLLQGDSDPKASAPGATT
jgi:hypothetical protein